MSAGAGHSFFVEIGTEELPPRDMLPLAENFRDLMRLHMEEMGFAPSERCHFEYFATPRRLALRATGFSITRKTIKTTKGPETHLCFTEQGEILPPGRGFFRKHGITITRRPAAGKKMRVGDAELSEAQGRLVLVHRESLPPPKRRLCQLAERALTLLPVNRRMRWGGGQTAFVRPIHWILLLLDDKKVSGEIAGIRTGNVTFGHRFSGRGRPVVLCAAKNYESLLKENGVIADIRERKNKIKTIVAAAAKKVNGRALLEESLLNEVCALVEWPQAEVGSFDKKYLSLPREVCIAVMQSHQRYFPVTDAHGKLLPHFIIVANTKKGDSATIIDGNERVIRPRLADAEFFHRRDLRRRLSSWRKDLRGIQFHEKLGSLFAKTERVGKLTAHIAAIWGLDKTLARRAGQLCKADLATELVREMDELQGVLGGHYAKSHQEKAGVAMAIAEHYRPRFAGDDLPKTALGAALALADRLDTLCGIFAAGARPTGSQDPFALRRAAMGAVRLILAWDKNAALETARLLDASCQGYGKELPGEKKEAVKSVSDYLYERLDNLWEETGYSAPFRQAILRVSPENLVDAQERLDALVSLSKDPAIKALAAIHKRVKNLLRTAKTTPKGMPKSELFTPPEKMLFNKMQSLRKKNALLCKDRQYKKALQGLAGLQEEVHSFFDTTLVMAENEQLRKNRIKLLTNLADIFTEIADISHIDTKSI